MRVTKPREERKAELVAAARRLFDENGITETRVSDIVQAVGVAQGVFYYYFPSKDAMVELVVQQVGEEISAKADAIIEDEKLDFCEKLSLFIHLYIDLVDQFLGDQETSLKSFTFEQDEAYPILGHSQALLSERIVSLVEAGAAEKVICLEYPKETTMVLILGLRALASQRLPTRQMIFTMIEECLGLPKNRLLVHCGKSKKAV